MGDLSDHFSLWEFGCHNGAPLPKNFHKTILETLEFLERLRAILNWHRIFIPDTPTGEIGLVVVSGHRTEEYNKEKNGAKNSRHVSGQAVDIRPKCGYIDTGQKKSPILYEDFWQMCLSVDKSFSNRAYRLGNYATKRKRHGGNTWVHVDCAYGFPHNDKTKSVRWYK